MVLGDAALGDTPLDRSGALEAAAAAASIGCIPPTAGLRMPDRALHLDVVAGAGRRFEPGPVLSNSFPFGGHNGCVVLGPPGSPRPGPRRAGPIDVSVRSVRWART